MNMDTQETNIMPANMSQESSQPVGIITTSQEELEIKKLIDIIEGNDSLTEIIYAKSSESIEKKEARIEYFVNICQNLLRYFTFALEESNTEISRKNAIIHAYNILKVYFTRYNPPKGLVNNEFMNKNFKLIDGLFSVIGQDLGGVNAHDFNHYTGPLIGAFSLFIETDLSNLQNLNAIDLSDAYLSEDMRKIKVAMTQFMVLLKYSKVDEMKKHIPEYNIDNLKELLEGSLNIKDKLERMVIDLPAEILLTQAQMMMIRTLLLNIQSQINLHPETKYIAIVKIRLIESNLVIEVYDNIEDSKTGEVIWPEKVKENIAKGRSYGIQAERTSEGKIISINANPTRSGTVLTTEAVYNLEGEVDVLNKIKAGDIFDETNSEETNVITGTFKCFRIVLPNRLPYFIKAQS